MKFEELQALIESINKDIGAYYKKYGHLLDNFLYSQNAYKFSGEIKNISADNISEIKVAIKELKEINEKYHQKLDDLFFIEDISLQLEEVDIAVEQYRAHYFKVIPYFEFS